MPTAPWALSLEIVKIIILQVDDHRHSIAARSKWQLLDATKFRLKILTQFIVHFSLIPIIHFGVNKSIVENNDGKKKAFKGWIDSYVRAHVQHSRGSKNYISETTSSSCCALCLADDYVSQRFFNSTRMRRKKSLWWESFIFQSRHRRRPQFFSISSLSFRILIMKIILIFPLSPDCSNGIINLFFSHSKFHLIPQLWSCLMLV